MILTVVTDVHVKWNEQKYLDLFYFSQILQVKFHV